MQRMFIDKAHELHIHKDSFSVYSGGIRLFRFFVQSPAATAENDDSAEQIRLTEVSEHRAMWCGENGAWIRKEYTVRVIDGGFVFTTKFYGNGAPLSIEYFKGTPDGTGSPFGVAGYLHINAQDRDRQRSLMLMTSRPAELTAQRSAPPPFVFPFFNDYNSDWCGIGVTTRAGNHNYGRFILNCSSKECAETSACWFSLPLGGYTVVGGEWKAPTIHCSFADSDMTIIRNYAEWSYNHYDFPRNTVDEDIPEWWKKPIFCGWGEQCAMYRRNPSGRHIKDYAAEDIYRGYCDTLDKLRLNPGTIIIDDKWQKEYGTLTPDTEKWPDLRGFVREQHEKGRHVVLWLRCWCDEGLPDDECIFVNGERYSVDPTNPKYLNRLREAIYRLLSSDEGCFDCDGFKVDFMDNQPKTAGAITYESGVAGLELMRRLFEAIRSFAKQAKPDALLNMSCAHPYFADLCEQYRLNDYDLSARVPISTMRYRADFVRAVMPEVLIDTDGFTAYTAPAQIRILEEAAQIGIPDLYYFPQFFGEAEWERVRALGF